MGDNIIVQVAGTEIETKASNVQPLLVGKTVPGIFLTNAVSREEEDVADVFLAYSRLNHACTPNATAISIDGMRGVFTSEFIKAGDEVCIEYFDEAVCMPSKKLSNPAKLTGVSAEILHIAFVRQQLFSKWGFWCACRRCAGVKEEADDALEK